MWRWRLRRASPRLASLPPVGFARRGHDVAAREHRGRREGKRRAGALGDLLVDLAAESGAVERCEPGLLAEDVAGVRPGEHVGLNLVHPLRELGERAGLRQHGGGDGTGGGRGDDVGHDPLDADQVLQDPDLERALGASSGEDERGAAGAAIRGHQLILAPRARTPQRCSTTRGSAHHFDQGPGTGGRSGPLGAWDDTAVHGDGHTPCTLVLDELRHEVGDRGAERHLHRLAVDSQRDHAHAGASASMSGVDGAAPYQVDDRRRSEGREEDPVAVMADGRHDALQAGPADAWHVVGRGRAQAGAGLEQFELVDTGDDLPGVAEQLVDGPRLHGGVDAALLDGGPDHQGAVRGAAPGRRSARARGRARSGSGAARRRPAGRRGGRGAGCDP